MARFILINKFKLVSYVMVLLLLPALLLGCGDNADSTEPFEFNAIPDQFNADAINIASINNVPSVRNAILLAVKQINEAGGVLGKPYNDIAIVASGADDAVRHAKKILEQDIKVINVSFSSRSKAVSQLSIAKQIPLISESATSPFFTDYADQDLYFRMVPSDVIQGRILAELAIEQGYFSAVTVHNDTDQYGETLVYYFTLNYEQLGGVVLSQIAVPFATTTGFDQYLQSITDKDPDMVLNVVLEADVSANFVNEAIAYGLPAKFLLPDASTGIAGFANNIADITSVVDMLGTAPGFGLASNPEMIYFDQSYRQQYGHGPDTFDVSGYDFAMVTALAIERAGYVNHTDDPTGLMVRDSLRAVMNPPGQMVGPSNIAEALALLRAGQEVDYSGSYGANDWDINGDITGEITYNVMSIALDRSWQTLFQQQLFIPLTSPLK
jgi:branched-chain amino acid transport system substrate-binding protein